MKDCTEKRLRDMIDFLDRKGYVITEGTEYPILKAAAKSSDILRGDVNLCMKLPKQEKKETHAEEPTVVNAALFTALKQLRNELAFREGVPAYMIFSNATLTDMSKKCPKTAEALLNVSGVGKVKLAKYGDKFLEVLRKF